VRTPLAQNQSWLLLLATVLLFSFGLLPTPLDGNCRKNFQNKQQSSGGFFDSILDRYADAQFLPHNYRGIGAIQFGDQLGGQFGAWLL